jgi:FdhD protein
MTSPVRLVDVFRARDRGGSSETDRVAVEEPLEIALEGHPFSVIMRTPGADADLVTGFLFSEGVIRSADDVRLVEIVSPNRANARLSRARAEILPDVLGQRRQVAMNSSCGLCGRRSLESLEVAASTLPARWSVAPDVIAALPGALSQAQRAFAQTGGLHAAGLFDLDGHLESSAEDVGRHNAVDKLIGRMLMRSRLPLDRSLLFVSGRSSFEIVQKAFVGGIPLVAAVSAPSSLAVDLAGRAGITLLGFVRDGRFNVYAHRERVEGLGAEHARRSPSRPRRRTRTR